MNFFSIIFKIFVFMAILSSCSKIFPDLELTLPKQQYLGKEIRIDGYYYCLLYTKDNVNTYEVYFLYNNGLLLYGGSTSNLDLFEDKLIKNKYNIGISKTDWGVFVVDKMSIKFERWYPGNVGQRLPVYVKEGIIVNDTTFQITKLYNPYDSMIEIINEIYHFKQFSPKPDSTNNFIK